MARFLSDEWITAFNTAVQDVDLEAHTSGSVRAGSGSFRVEERVSGVPGRAESDGPLRIVLRVEDGSVSLSVGDGDDAGRPDVVMVLAYDDAAALSRGQLDATEALGSGRVHVRGDLSVLVAGQSILAAASAGMAGLQADTTY